MDCEPFAVDATAPLAARIGQHREPSSVCWAAVHHGLELLPSVAIYSSLESLVEVSASLADIFRAAVVSK